MGDELFTVDRVERTARSRWLRVVVVDDQDLLRGLVRTLLEEAGHEVVAEAPDGRAGVDQVVACRPDLVIMDWSMPVMDGVQATREIRMRCPDVALIAFSSANDPAVRDAFLRDGAAWYVDKADARGLLAAVAELAGRGRRGGANPPTR